MSKGSELLELPTYDPNALIDFVRMSVGAKNDRAMCDIVGVSTVLISKIRNRKLALGADTLLAFHEATDVPVKELKALMGDHRIVTLKR